MSGAAAAASTEPENLLKDAPGYTLAVMTVDHFFSAQKRDLLPEETTELVLGMSGETGRTLFGAFGTLKMHGRISRTMMEQALCYSATSYPEYVQLWIRSLPPEQRSMYAADLYNTNFRNVKWDNIFCKRVAVEMQGDDYKKVQPPVPLGDDRHDPKNAKAVHLADEFFQLFSMGLLFGGAPGDLHAKLEKYEGFNEDEDGLNILRSSGPFFGISFSDLVWGQRSDEGRTMTNSELILRAWNALYFCERLSRTELEYALVNGSMFNLMFVGLHVALMQARGKGKPAVVEGRDLFQKAQNFLRGILNKEHDGDTPLFAKLVVDESSDEKFLECDYCGNSMEKSLRCSRCQTSMYCSKECQKGDWKRHEPLCNRYLKKLE